MAFKSLLESLFKLSGGQAMPSGQSVQVGLPQSGVYFYYTAPSDGYLVARFTGAEGVTTVQLEASVVWLCNDRIPSVTHWGGAIPIRKGEQASVLFRYTSAGSSLGLLFCPTAGSASS